MQTFIVTILDHRVNVTLPYEVTAASQKEAEKLAVQKANADAGTPKWLSIFEAVYTEVQ